MTSAEARNQAASRENRAHFLGEKAQGFNDIGPRITEQLDPTTDPRFMGQVFPPFITVAQPVAIPLTLASNTALDPREIAALALALERGIADVLIDESSGRAAALAPGLHVSGRALRA